VITQAAGDAGQHQQPDQTGAVAYPHRQVGYPCGVQLAQHPWIGHRRIGQRQQAPQPDRRSRSRRRRRPAPEPRRAWRRTASIKARISSRPTAKNPADLTRRGSWLLPVRQRSCVAPSRSASCPGPGLSCSPRPSAGPSGRTASWTRRLPWSAGPSSASRLQACHHSLQCTASISATVELRGVSFL
jgi:hypothetical protein